MTDIRVAWYQHDNPPCCECHECTQARYKQSMHYQFDQYAQRQKENNEKLTSVPAR